MMRWQLFSISVMYVIYQSDKKKTQAKRVAEDFSNWTKLIQ